jgi:hypothetical protein
MSSFLRFSQLIAGTVALAYVSPWLLAAVLAAWASYHVYLYRYFNSNDFSELKDAVSAHVEDCNSLNEHISELRSTYTVTQSQNYGTSSLSDASVYNYTRAEWAKSVQAHWVHNCSSTVVKNAHNQPFKYLCKYFNISPTESTLEQVEHALNSFAAAEQGRILLLKEREEIMMAVSTVVPAVVRILSKNRLVQKLGFQPVDLSDIHFPVYSFQYVSAAGKSSFNCDITLDIPNLEQFALYISDLVKFRNSVAGQRALMTSSLREKIKNRDNHTCQTCGLSTADEKNLLLEIDHKIPLSKGGFTTESNLQTLCWRCNRKKGAKLL